MPFAADILLHLLDAFDRHVQPILAGVLQMQEIPFHLAQAQVQQPAVEGDAVIGMHDVIALP